MYLLLWMKDTNRRMGGGRPAHNINYCGYLKNVKYVCFVCKTYWMFDYSEWLISADILFLLAISSIIYCITVICVGPLLEKLLPLLSWMVTADVFSYLKSTFIDETQNDIIHRNGYCHSFYCLSLWLPLLFWNVFFLFRCWFGYIIWLKIFIRDSVPFQD